jgi:hypothetical protein
MAQVGAHSSRKSAAGCCRLLLMPWQPRLLMSKCQFRVEVSGEPHAAGPPSPCL